MSIQAYLHRKRDQARAHGVYCVGKLRINFRSAKGPRKGGKK